MKKIIPQNNMVLCRKVAKESTQQTTGFIYDEPTVPLFYIEAFGPKVQRNNININDLVILANGESSCTKAVVDDVEWFLVPDTSIAGVVK